MVDQKESRVVEGEGRGSRGSVYFVFIDGIGDHVTYLSLKREVRGFGKVMEVFLQRRKKQGRSSRFGFVRFKYKQDAEKAIECLDGAKNSELFAQYKHDPVWQGSGDRTC